MGRVIKKLQRGAEIAILCSIWPAVGVCWCYGSYKLLMYSFGGKDMFRKVVIQEPIDNEWVAHNPKHFIYRDTPLSHTPKELPPSWTVAALSTYENMFSSKSAPTAPTAAAAVTQSMTEKVEAQQQQLRQAPAETGGETTAAPGEADAGAINSNDSIDTRETQVPISTTQSAMEYSIETKPAEVEQVVGGDHPHSRNF